MAEAELQASPASLAEVVVEEALDQLQGVEGVEGVLKQQPSSS